MRHLAINITPEGKNTVSLKLTLLQQPQWCGCVTCDLALDLNSHKAQ
jgi:hypothetical protein